MEEDIRGSRNGRPASLIERHRRINRIEVSILYYGIYKSIRNSAWQCLLDFQLDKLPIDVLQIARAMGVRVIKNSLVNDLLPNENGKAYYDGQQWIIIYNDQNPIELSRFTIAHELGHILLGHELTHVKYAEVKEFKIRPRSEQQADAFAIRLLCPACVLGGLELHTAEEISAHCRIPEALATSRAKRMKELYRRGKFLTDPLEEQLYRQFHFN